jgi:hypothetical protein
MMRAVSGAPEVAAPLTAVTAEAVEKARQFVEAVLA